ncbi:Gfo/Idh/MocA family oxidoreductase [Rhizobium sp. MC63]|uniref:Gfo/Idh/MocA family oxidoreductase n=1 Tax=Rhizobium mulingense TaxID=3031128 RepID=A0ACC6N2X8_9HYPH|nr:MULTISPECIES: Gfo/Idh/MocA family oxidoreductase [unclassified Rhizobium]MDF0699426.1 Gfo/Idh/MocA family oxidoreductase [Rhizobium sp. MC63]MEA3519743.1 Gfo/Idh/MocA family oxidoreductase [Rhizobium sp. MJ31]PDV86037.1 hypothetical protein CO652_23050 [Rhizobium sp. H4]
MVLRIGVIGTGAIGREHVRRINQVLAGARIVALSDVHRPSAEAVKSSSAPDAIVLDRSEELLGSPHVDAVAAITADACVRAQETDGQAVRFELPPRPDLYR